MKNASDRVLRQKALDKLAGNSDKTPDLKLGEPLDKKSGYPERFINDYNVFQEMFNTQKDSKPQEFWDYGQNWYSEVKRLIDQHREDYENGKKESVIKLLRP